MDMRTTRLTVRVSEAMYKALKRRCTKNGEMVAFVRETLAAALGDPSLAAVNPEGRPPRKRPRPSRGKGKP